MAYEFSDASFYENGVLVSELVTVIHMSAEWCGPCQLMAPIVEELSTEFEGRAVIGWLNVDDHPKAPTIFSVRGVPTFLFFKNGELKDKIVNLPSKQVLKDKIETLISYH